VTKEIELLESIETEQRNSANRLRKPRGSTRHNEIFDRGGRLACLEFNIESAIRWAVCISERRILHPQTRAARIKPFQAHDRARFMKRTCRD